MGVILKEQDLKPSAWDDTSTVGVIYLGYPAPNSDADDLTHCVIEQIDTNNGTIKYADGDDLNYVHEWNKRLTYTYNNKNNI